jgi:DNA-binding transcriptional MerR regulator
MQRCLSDQTAKGNTYQCSVWVRNVFGITMPDQTIQPDKLYYKIGEVSRIVGLPSHVIRFWEHEFSKIKPHRTPSGQRLYTQRNIEIILEIKRLLYDQKYTIKGARQFMKSYKSSALPSVLADIRLELEQIKAILS